MEQLTRPKTHYKLRALVYDFYAKIQSNIKFNLTDLISYHNVSRNARMALNDKYELMRQKGDECKYIWCGNPPTEDDIIAISNKMYNFSKEYNLRNKPELNKIQFPDEQKKDIEAVKSQLSMLQEMFSHFIK
jgi:hypothetical protein